MNISVIIPSYNTQATLPSTLDCLQRQVTEATFEVIVVDCSEHEKVAELVRDYPGFKCIRRPERFNPGIGRNIGAEQAAGDLLVFIDADVQLMPTCLDLAWQHYRSGCNIVGGALELNAATSHGIAAYLEHFFFNHESQASHPPCERNNLSSAFMCFERALFQREGGFKNIARMQDTELTERLRKRGYKLCFRPSMLAYQTQDSSLRKVLRKIFINGQNVYAIRYRTSSNLLQRLLFLLTLPLITMAKIARIIYRHLRYNQLRNKFITIAITPALIAGGAFWMVGFYGAIIAQKDINPNR